jgi:hypothetical protein
VAVVVADSLEFLRVNKATALLLPGWLSLLDIWITKKKLAGKVQMDNAVLIFNLS